MKAATRPAEDEDVEVTFTLPRSVLESAEEMVRESDPALCPLFAMEGPTTVNDFLAWLVEEKLR